MVATTNNNAKTLKLPRKYTVLPKSKYRERVSAARGREAKAERKRDRVGDRAQSLFASLTCATPLSLTLTHSRYCVFVFVVVVVHKHG